MLVKSIKDDLNSSYALYDNNLLVGFRITYAPTKWVPDQWCSPQLWSVKKEHIAYLKNAIPFTQTIREKVWRAVAQRLCKSTEKKWAQKRV